MKKQKMSQIQKDFLWISLGWSFMVFLGLGLGIWVYRADVWTKYNLLQPRLLFSVGAMILFGIYGGSCYWKIREDLSLTYEFVNRRRLRGMAITPIIIVSPLIFLSVYIMNMSDTGLAETGWFLIFCGAMGFVFHFVMFIGVSIAWFGKKQGW